MHVWSHINISMTQVKLLYLCGWTHKVAHVFKNVNAIPNILMPKSDTNPLNNYIAKKRICFRIAKKCCKNFKNPIGFFLLLLRRTQNQCNNKITFRKAYTNKISYCTIELVFSCMFHLICWKPFTIQCFKSQKCNCIQGNCGALAIVIFNNSTRWLDTNKPSSHILLKTVLDNSLPPTRAADITYFFADLIVAVYFSIYWLHSFLPPDIIVDHLTAPGVPQWKNTSAALHQFMLAMTAITQILYSQALERFSHNMVSCKKLGQVILIPCDTVLIAIEKVKHYFYMAGTGRIYMKHQ